MKLQNGFLSAINNGFVYTFDTNTAKCDKTRNEVEVDSQTPGAHKRIGGMAMEKGQLVLKYDDKDPRYFITQYEHEAPQMSCTCGFWAYYTLEEAFRNYKDIIGFPQNSIIVLAATDAYGRVTI